MDIRDKLNELIKKTLSRIQESAGKSEIDRVQNFSYMLTQARYISQNLDELENKLEKLETEFLLTSKKAENVPNESIIDPTASELESNLSAKAKAKIKRTEFIKELRRRGINLEPFKGVVYRNIKNDGLIGIAYSCDNGDSWFLGLPDKIYETVVLLCDKESGNTNVIILPKDFYSKHKDNLSKSNGQMKFNVRFSDEKLVLYTRAGNVSVEKYLNNFEVF